MLDDPDGIDGGVMERDADYWRRRETCERGMARRARCKRARRAHHDLASIYAARHGGAAAAPATPRSPWQALCDRLRLIWSD